MNSPKKPTQDPEATGTETDNDLSAGSTAISPESRARRKMRDTGLTDELIRECASRSKCRIDLWVHLLRLANIERMAEIGVYRGCFAARILRDCGLIEKYYMIDPWRHLDHWDKPANDTDRAFEEFLSETVSKTDFAMHKRIILRGETAEVVDKIADDELDFAYIDGDHTLRGIAIDLIRVFPKIKAGGWLGGDDFGPSAWQHSTRFEPTLVFPFAVHFAEAAGARIYALPYSQFLIEKSRNGSFAFVDMVGGYADSSLKEQFSLGRIAKLKLAENFALVAGALRAVSRLRRKRASLTRGAGRASHPDMSRAVAEPREPSRKAMG